MNSKIKANALYHKFNIFGLPRLADAALGKAFKRPEMTHAATATKLMMDDTVKIPLRTAWCSGVDMDDAVIRPCASNSHLLSFIENTTALRDLIKSKRA